MGTGTRRPVFGPGRLLVLVYGLFAVAATARATWQLVTAAEEAPLAYGLSALAGVVYIVATAALVHNGRQARLVAALAVGFELVGVLVVGSLSVVLTELFPDATVWSQFGGGYGYVPLVLPVAGIAWLWWSGRQEHAPAADAGAEMVLSGPGR